MAIEETLAPHRRAALHRDALAALVAPPAGAPDPARLAHHAEAAGDADAVLRFAPAAAARAESVGAHREAAAQYARALRFGAELPPARQVELLEGRSRSAFRADDCGEAIEALEQALDGHRVLGDRLKEGDRLRRLSGVLFCPGDRSGDAARTGSEAVTVLEGLAPGRELGLAYANMATLCMNREDADGTVAWSARAMEVADRLDDVEIRVQTLNTTGTMELLAGTPAGREKLERSIALAREAGLGEDVARGFSHLAWTGLRTAPTRPPTRPWPPACDTAPSPATTCGGCTCRASAPARPSTRAGGPRPPRRHPSSWATRAPRRFPASPPASCSGSCARAGETRAVGRARCRPRPGGGVRGAAAHRGGGRRASRVGVAARRSRRRRAGDRGRLRPREARTGRVGDRRARLVAPACGDLRGDPGRRGRALRRCSSPATGSAPRRCGRRSAVPTRRRWRAPSGTPTPCAGALAELQEMGAHPAAAIVARRLRARGARGLPRGPRRVTRGNPANLTPRQVEVLALLAAGAAQPPDRRAALPLAQDGRPSRRRDPAQARRPHARRGGRRRPAAGGRRRGAVNADARRARPARRGLVSGGR